MHSQLKLYSSANTVECNINHIFNSTYNSFILIILNKNLLHQSNASNKIKITATIIKSANNNSIVFNRSRLTNEFFQKFCHINGCT